MIKPTFIASLILVGLVFWAFSSKASTVAYFDANGTQISKADYKVLDLKQSEDIIELNNILNRDSPTNLDAKHQVQHPMRMNLMKMKKMRIWKTMRSMKKMRSMKMK